MESCKEQLVRAINEKGVFKARIRTKKESCSGSVEVILKDGFDFFISVDWVDVNQLTQKPTLGDDLKFFIKHHDLKNEPRRCLYVMKEITQLLLKQKVKK